MPGPDGNRYDDDALVELLSYLDEDYDGTGWTAEDVEALITPPDDLPPAAATRTHVPEPPAEPVSAPGDLLLLGAHRLLCGDATNPDDLKRVTEGLGAPGDRLHRPALRRGHRDQRG